MPSKNFDSITRLSYYVKPFLSIPPPPSLYSFDVHAKPEKLSTIMVIRFRLEQKLSTCQSKLARKINGNAGAGDNYPNKSYRLI